MNSGQAYNYFLQSVENGMRILRLFSLERPEWGVTEIANSLSLSKSSVSRLIGDLVAEGFLEKSPTSAKYRLGLSLLCLSGVITSFLEIHREAICTLKELVEMLEETAHISVLEDSNIVYLHKVECKHPVRLLSHIGRKNPAFCTSSGKVLLAFQPEKSFEKAMEAGLPKMGPNSITDPVKLYEDLQNVRRQGYSVCIDEMHEDVVSIGAPVKDYTGRVVASVSVVGPRQRIGEEKIPHFVSAVVQAGKEISARLGYSENFYNDTYDKGD